MEAQEEMRAAGRYVDVTLETREAGIDEDEKELSSPRLRKVDPEAEDQVRESLSTLAFDVSPLVKAKTLRKVDSEIGTKEEIIERTQMDEEIVIRSNTSLFVNGSLFVLNPNHLVVWFWYLVVFVSCLYTVTLLPFEVSFMETPSLNIKLDYVIQGLFIADILFNFHIALRTKYGELVYDRAKIRSWYLRTWLIFDLAAVLPYYWIQYEPVQFFEGFLRVPKLIRLLKALNLSSYQFKSFFVLLPYRTRAASGFQRILKLLIYLVIFTHFSACLWYYLGRSDSDDPDSWIVRNWSNVAIADKSVGVKYVTSIYWVVTTLLTVGYGDLTPRTNWEIIYGICIMITGAIFFTYISGSQASLVSEYDKETREYQDKVNRFDGFCEAYGVSDSLRRKISSKMKARWKQPYSSISWSEISSLMPEKFKYKVAFELFSDIIDVCELFQLFRSDQGFVKKLLSSLEPQTFTKGEYIARKGDYVDALYIIRSGRIKLIRRKGDKKATFEMSSGNFFGEIGIFLWPEWESAVRCTERTQILKIARDRLMNLVDQHEGTLEMFRERAQIRHRFLEEHFSRILGGAVPVIGTQQKLSRSASPSPLPMVSVSNQEVTRIISDIQRLQKAVASMQVAVESLNPRSD